jgi:hypothetical protein
VYASDPCEVTRLAVTDQAGAPAKTVYHAQADRADQRAEETMSTTIADYVRRWRMDKLYDKFEGVAAYRMPRATYHTLISTSSFLVDVLLNLSKDYAGHETVTLVRSEARAYYPTAEKIILPAVTVHKLRSFWSDHANALHGHANRIADMANAGEISLAAAREKLEALAKMVIFHGVAVDVNADLTPAIRRAARQANAGCDFLERLVRRRRL